MKIRCSNCGCESNIMQSGNQCHSPAVPNIPALADAVCMAINEWGALEKKTMTLSMFVGEKLHDRLTKG